MSINGDIKDSNLPSFIITIKLKKKKKKKKSKQTSKQVVQLEAFNPNNVAMGLWLVFIK